MPPYGYALGDEAVHTFTRLPVRHREKLLRLLDWLAHHPNQSGDYHEPGINGRLYEVKLHDDLLLTWWTDHAEREVLIVRIERVE